LIAMAALTVDAITTSPFIVSQPARACASPWL
jgi:hypothetical protein